MFDVIKRGEIYMCDLGKPVNHIQAGERPVIVVSNDTGNRHSPFVLVCPLTGVKKKRIVTHVDVTARFPSVAMCETVIPIMKKELKEYVRKASKTEMASVNDALKISLGMED